jgi:hypothetical protein
MNVNDYRNRLKLRARGFRGLRIQWRGLEPKEIRTPLAAHPVSMRSCMEQSCRVGYLPPGCSAERSPWTTLIRDCPTPALSKGLPGLGSPGYLASRSRDNEGGHSEDGGVVREHCWSSCPGGRCRCWRGSVRNSRWGHRRHM